MVKLLIFAFCSIFALASSAAIAQEPIYELIPLPPVSGFSESEAMRINDQGVVVGTSRPGGDELSGIATRWNDGSPQSLGKFPKGIYSVATAINNLGAIAGSADSGDGRPNSVIFTAKTPQFIAKGAFNSNCVFVSDSGFIVGNFTKGTGPWVPAVWSPDPKKPGKFTQLLLPAYQNSTINSIFDANNAGAAVGYALTSTGQRAMVWSKNKPIALPALDNELGSIAHGINDIGDIVGEVNWGDSRSVAVLWVAGVPIELPVPSETSYSSASDLNDVGQIIGSYGPTRAPAAWIEGRFVDLQFASDAIANGWQLLTVTDINNFGEIVGNGNLNGKPCGFILRPISH